MQIDSLNLRLKDDQATVNDQTNAIPLAIQEERIRWEEKLVASQKIQDGLVEELEKLHEYCAKMASWQPHCAKMASPMSGLIPQT